MTVPEIADAVVSYTTDQALTRARHIAGRDLTPGEREELLKTLQRMGEEPL